MRDILPIHPIAALVLKNIASAFQSNQRSMFDFIKTPKDMDVKAFQWFIQNTSPLSDRPFLTVDMLWDFFYEKVQAIQPDYERNQFNNMRISDLISVYRTLVLRGTYTGDPKLVISEAAAQRKRLPEQKAMTQLQSVVEYLAAEAVESGIREVRKLWLPVLSGRLYLSELQSFTGRCFDGRNWPGAPKRFRLGATVGFGDDPENQAQMDVGIDFASGGHHMVCGTVSTGKSTFLQTAVFSLCSHYSPEQLNVYALDFSSQMLTVFEDSVHVGGVLTDADTENDRIAKFFTLIGKIISERKRLFKGTNFTDYVNHNGWTIPAILIAREDRGGIRGGHEPASQGGRRVRHIPAGLRRRHRGQGDPDQNG